jgi:hypothetical protein
MKNLFLSFVVLGFATTSIIAQEVSTVKKATPIVNIEPATTNNDKDAKAACCKGKDAKNCAKGKNAKSCAGKEAASTPANGSAAKPACCASKATGKPGCSGGSAEKKEESTK